MHVCEQKFQEAWLSVKIPTYIKIAPGSALIFKRRSILTNVLHCRVTQTLNFPALEFPSATIIVIITITIIIVITVIAMITITITIIITVIAVIMIINLLITKVPHTAVALSRPIELIYLFDVKSENSFFVTV